MRRPSFIATTAFRVAIVNALAFGVVAMLCFAGLYWMASRNVLAQLDSATEGERRELLTVFNDGGLTALEGELRRRGESPHGGETYYLLMAADGRRLAGSLPPGPVSQGPAWLDLPPGVAGPERVTLRVEGIGLPDGSSLLIGRDAMRLEELREFFVNGLGWTELVTVVLGLVSGYLASRRVLGGVQTIADTADRIGAGDLSRRIPYAGHGDEIARIGTALNLMLDRIGMLTDSLRQVTDDIAHDLRTPLSRLRQTLERTTRTDQSATELRDAIDNALDEVDAIIATFNAMLRIGQIEGQHRRGGFTHVDLSSLVSRLVDAYGPSAEDGGHSLKAEIAPGMRTFGDADSLGQMIANLIENALRHTPSGTGLTVGVTAIPGGRDRAVPRLTVTDNGPGIQAADRDRVLRRFVRLDASRGTQGTGLGLALVKAVADLHGASLVLEDARPGLRVVVSFTQDMETIDTPPTAAPAGHACSVRTGWWRRRPASRFRQPYGEA